MDLQTAIRSPVMLQGANYLLWSRTMRTTLCSKGLWTHITNPVQSAIQGEEAHAEEAVAAQMKWYQEDQLVLSVLQNSLTNSLLEAYSYCESAKDLWETLQIVYGNTNNLMRIFEVKKSLSELKQEDVEFTKHYGSFRALWAELEMLRPATIDPITLHERREQDKVFGLLLTLNTSYTDLIKHILREDKLPSLEEVCAKIQKEQGSQELFDNKAELVAAHKSFFKSTKNEPQKKKQLCDHCKRTGHSKKECWVLHPELKPSWFVDKSNSPAAGPSYFNKVHEAGSSSMCYPVQGQLITTPPVVHSSDFVKRSDLEALLQTFKSGNVLGKSLHASFHTSNASKSLVVDSGASHHMISDLGLLENLTPTLGSVMIANGINVPIKGIGKLKLFDKESKAFYMPSFTSNLLSVKRATTDLNCQVIFGPNDFYFQDIKTSRKFGQGTIRNDLYVLEDLSMHHVVESCANSVDLSVNAELWHARLGHPHPRALELIVPGTKLQNEICESCILGKHCRTVFEKSTHSYDNCFDLVHSDVWTSLFSSRETKSIL